MGLLRSYFEDPRDGHESYRRTGTFVWELYAARASAFWLSPSYAASEDDPDGWREGALRVNPYWFADSADDPARGLFTGLWDLLRDNGIPFRLHWGKINRPRRRRNPIGSNWFAAQYPRWNDFLALRRELDPDWHLPHGLLARPARPLGRAATLTARQRAAPRAGTPARRRCRCARSPPRTPAAASASRPRRRSRSARIAWNRW